jgi:hypothetical protein
VEAHATGKKGETSTGASAEAHVFKSETNFTSNPYSDNAAAKGTFKADAGTVGASAGLETVHGVVPTGIEASGQLNAASFGGSLQIGELTIGGRVNVGAGVKAGVSTKGVEAGVTAGAGASVKVTWGDTKIFSKDGNSYKKDTKKPGE